MNDGNTGQGIGWENIPSPAEYYWVDVEGDIENVNNVLKITQIRVTSHLKVPQGKVNPAREAISSYLTKCSAAQSVIGCIDIQNHAIIEELSE